MIIVLSQPDINENEVSLINQLFDAGMQLFHLRKPTATEQEVRFILEGIRPECRNRIVLNQSYFLGEEFGINRFHFSTQQRLDSVHKEWIKEGNILSTSTHSFEEYKELDECFEYAFISPVFDSISKPDYKKVELTIDKRKKTTVKLIALGGIDENNCSELNKNDFDGIALLGSVWKSEFPLQSFKKINQLWNIHAR